MTTPDLKSYFDNQLDDMVELLKDFAAIESPTSAPAAVNTLGMRVMEELHRLKAKIKIHHRHEVGNIIEGRWNTEADGKPLLFVSHMDTVHPVGSLSLNPIRLEDGLLYGPGTYDMKASIVCVLYAIGGLIDQGLLPDRPITVLMTSDEETGSGHSRDLIKELAAESALSLIMEPALPDGSLKTWRKSVGEFTVRTSGKASHAGGAHESGLNAIEEMAHQILALQGMTDYKVGTTVSVGMISGGTARNTIPDSCELAVDARAMTEVEMERLTEQILALKPVMPGASVDVSGGFDRPPMERDDLMMATFEQAQTIGQKYGLTLRESGTGGASDGNYTASIGVPTLDGLGPIGNGAHSEREHVIVRTMVNSTTLLAALLLDWPTA